MTTTTALSTRSARPSPRLGASVIAAALLGGCSHRIPVPAGDGGVDAPALDDAGEICPGLAPRASVAHEDPAGIFRVVAAPALSAGTVAIRGAPEGASAMALDRAPLSGFAMVRRPPAGGAQQDAVAAMAALLARARGHLAATVSVRSSGTQVSTGALTAAKEAVWQLDYPTPTDGPRVRRALLAALLDVEPAALSGIAAPPDAPSTRSVVVKLSVSLWRQRLAVSAALAPRADFDGGEDALAALIDDVGNGTALAPAGTPTQQICDSVVHEGPPSADIIFVVDESGSMFDNREDIVNHANAFFAKALAASLDFRIAVAGMKDPAKAPELGKLCSAASSDPTDPGGEDRFLRPDEATLFSACVTNPPFFEGGDEFGLAQGYHAVARHLPPADDDPQRIRAGAKLALIFVTDETAQELKVGSSYEGNPGFLEYADITSCQLPPEKAARVNEYLAPWFALLAGASAGGEEAIVHVIGGTCGNACEAEGAFGYQELAHRFGGQIGDVCQEDLGPTLDLMIESIVAAATPHVLRHVPISATLAVDVNGVPLPRSRAHGFVYSSAANSLSFANVTLRRGDEIRAAYQRFVR